MITQKDKELLTDWLCTNVKVEPSVIGLIVKHVDNYFQSIPAKEELEARDRRVAAEAFTAGQNFGYADARYDQGKLSNYDYEKTIDKEQYINILISK